ncbi:hypothetical protein WN990_10320 [Kitasatospora purpeofusca]|uniref:hypothetical protein n=1 Tax=Kitasatospora purpeofusca TaxID=67352 RepID=UPI0030F2835B
MYFAIPMAIIGVTYPLFRFGSEAVRRAIGWPFYAAALALTVTGLLYCAWSRRSPRVGGVTCAIAVAVTGVLAHHRYGPPW